MGLCRIIILTSLIGFVSLIWLIFIKKQNVHLPDTVYEDHYWGKQILKEGNPLPKDDVTIRPFKVVYDEAIIKDLHLRLDKARFVEPILNNFENGFNGDYLKKLVHYWRHTFNWKKQVDFLNSFPQFVTQIEGLDVHFVRIKPEGNPKIVKPFMLVNGWPSNYHQYYKLAELLRKPVNDVAFEIIVPSRPGYGFSEQPHRANFSVVDSARIYVKLMKRLGHNKFFYAGEDWGAIEGHAIGALYPENVEGVHLGMGLADLDLKSLIKMAVGSYLPSLIYSEEFEAKQFEAPFESLKKTFSEMGYFMIQSTKPDTVGASLIDSPTGLAAYIGEKYSTWVNKNYISLPDGGLTKSLTLDEILTNIMVFWSTGNGAYSTRYYKEFSKLAFSGQDITKVQVNHKVPFGFSIGEFELDVGKLRPNGKYNLVKFDYIKGAGHFSSFEDPVQVADHLRKFVSIVNELNEKSKHTDL